MKSNKSHTYFTTPEEAEIAFYSAFEMLDISLMDSVLADKDGCCIHPGGVIVMDHQEILNSWKYIFSQMEPFSLQHEVLSKTVTEDRAAHVVAEVITLTDKPGTPTSIVLATNVYIRQENGWRLFHHHASSPSGKDMLEKLTLHKAPSSLQ